MAFLCFIIEKLSKERFNPVAINRFVKEQNKRTKLTQYHKFSFRYNGMVNKKGVEVTPNKTGKTGVTVTLKTKKTKKAHSVVLTKNSRQTLKTVKGLMSGYHPALTKVAQKRASKILISQKPLKAKRQKSE